MRLIQRNLWPVRLPQQARLHLGSQMCWHHAETVGRIPPTDLQEFLAVTPSRNTLTLRDRLNPVLPIVQPICIHLECELEVAHQ